MPLGCGPEWEPPPAMLAPDAPATRRARRARPAGNLAPDAPANLVKSGRGEHYMDRNPVGSLAGASEIPDARSSALRRALITLVPRAWLALPYG